MKLISYKKVLTYLSFLSIISVLLSNLTVQADELSSHRQAHSLMGSHGMVLIHDERVGFFVSHLPLYNQPHNFQLIYKVKISEPDKLLNLLKNGLVTVLPDNFDLSKLINGENFSINTAFYQGHFERGGLIKFTTKMSFEKPILIKKVSPEFNSKSSIIYTVPMSNQVTFFAHKIQQTPSFDAIGFIDSDFIDSSAIKHYKSKSKSKDGDGIDYLTCDKPEKLDTKTIQERLQTCQKFNIKYIETKDFS